MNKWIAGIAVLLLPHLAVAAEKGAKAVEAVPAEPADAPWIGLVIMGVIALGTIIFTLRMMRPGKDDDSK